MAIPASRTNYSLVFLLFLPILMGPGYLPQHHNLYRCMVPPSEIHFESNNPCSQNLDRKKVVWEHEHTLPWHGWRLGS